MLPSNLFFMLMLFISTLIVISSPSWFCIWMGVEVNMMAFIPMLIKSKSNLSTESSLKYFLTQSFASMIMMIAIIVISNQEFNLMFNSSSSMILIANGIKSGSAPFHMWYPPVVEGLMWNQNLILMTWQKIAPMFIMSMMTSYNFFMLMSLMSALVGPINGLNQSSLRKIMAYSSITHISWMIASMIILSSLWLFYMLIYFMTTIMILIVFNIYNLYHSSQISKFSLNLPMMLMMTILLLSMGGFPPMLGFLGKWIILNNLIYMNLIFLSIILILSSWLNLYIYIRIVHPFLHLNFNQNKMMMLSSKNIILISSMTLISLMILPMMILLS